MIKKNRNKRILYHLCTCILITASTNLYSALLNLSTMPIFLPQSVPPLTMLVMSRDHKLYFPAYNDVTDLNGDGVIETKYTPTIDYFGYFDSYKCYQYSSSYDLFQPISFTSTKKCNGLWSGDFLNYLTTSRIDALRKVLYGGYRIFDPTSKYQSTVLERAYITQDAHTWGKDYTSPEVDGFDISEYTPFDIPRKNKKHLFANTTLIGTTNPLLRVVLNQNFRIEEWVITERPVVDSKLFFNTGNKILDYVVRAEVCKPGLIESNCKLYPNGNYKPIGLLQELGENDSMLFGLITGSYTKNLSGGVLRKNISSITDEINSDNGTYLNTNGIINTLDKLKAIGFGSNYSWNQNCGWIINRSMQEGECRMWGNPIAEMMYESLRYFAGKKYPTSAFSFNGSGTDDSLLGLPTPTWQDPYDPSLQNWCAKANLLVISDTNPSYDTDNLPGSFFSSFTGDLNPPLDVSALGQLIWNTEFGNSSILSYIAQSGNNYDSTPSPKLISSFGNVRGLPEEPNKAGGYYAASVAYYGRTQNISSVQGTQNVFTYVVALDSPLPQIKIMVNQKLITLIPFAKVVGPKPPSSCFGGVDPTKSAFQPTARISGIKVQSITNTSGSFLLAWDDAEQGADFDMDAKVQYQYQVNPDNTVTISLDSLYGAGCLYMHIGYIISGTIQDGIYLEVRNSNTPAGQDVNYFLDTPPGQPPNGQWQTGNALPLTSSRTFTLGNSPAANFLNNPLWYAAKWGGFSDANNTLKPDSKEKWDQDGDGIPDNYFLVTNALMLKEQIKKAFTAILNRSSSSSPITITNRNLNTNTKIFQSKFNSYDWSGDLRAFNIDPSNGNIILSSNNPDGSIWSASVNLSSLNFNTQRSVLTYNSNSKKSIPFRWPFNPESPSNNELTKFQIASLNTNPITNYIDNLGQKRLNYIRGDTSFEQKNRGNFRNRSSLLGDIIDSQPTYIAMSTHNYPDTWPSGSPENNFVYSQFKQSTLKRTGVIYFGSNDGMIHAIKASDGREIFSYIPNVIFSKLSNLTIPNYIHEYFVNGPINISDVFVKDSWKTVLIASLNGGGRGIFALDITDPDTINENNANKLALWEYTDSDSKDLGYTYGSPAIVRLNNGQWGAIFGNGYNNIESPNSSITGNAVLYIVNIADGKLIKKFDTQVGMSQDPLKQNRPNGLAAPAILDINGNNIADYIYVGDLFGNFWKIDISDLNSDNWKFSFTSNDKPIPLFVAKNNNNEIQPITSQPIIKKYPKELCQYMIYFGTGKALEPSDKSSTEIQSIYGLIDDFSTTIQGRSQLLEQQIVDQVSVATNNDSNTYRITSNNQLLSHHKGWYMDLFFNKTLTGERILTQPILWDDKIIFTTTIPAPGGPCSQGGYSWLIELNAIDGSRLNYSPFDVNQDGLFDIKDFVKSSILSEPIPISAQKYKDAIVTPPVIASNHKGEFKYFADSSGKITVIKENRKNYGRQSWRQIK